MPRGPRRRPHAPPVGAVVAVLVVLVGCQVASVSTQAEFFDRYVSNVVQLVAGLAAAATTAARARSATGRPRWSWGCLSAGTAAWSAGQAWWCWVQIVQGGEAPFPSFADVGFVAFPLLAGASLMLQPTSDGSTARTRRALDAAMTSAAVGLVSWVTTLGAVVAANTGNDPLVGALLVGYPMLDVLVIVLGTLTIARATTDRLPQALVTVGLIAFSVSDSAFAYVAAEGDYDGNLLDLGWIAGFLLIALAALCPASVAAPVQVSGQRAGEDTNRSDHLLYVPVAVAFAVTTVLAFRGRQLDGWELLTAGVVVALLLARQYLALRDNSQLATELATRESELRHQAFHDGLTGLANRALFLDRLDHALALHARDLRPVAVVFLDLDDFKVVNDTLGHAVGDELLVRVAERLTGAVRTGDTVARLGGDEFAVLLEDGGDPMPIAAKVSAALVPPFTLRGDVVEVHASVGICELDADDAPLAADELLARSDTAMYSAKRSGKDRIVAYSPGMSLAELQDAALRDALRTAIDDRVVRLHYQPIVELETGRVAGLEALARWRHEGVDVPPDVFIPLAERSGLMKELTADLLAAACARLASWTRGRPDPLSVHVNVAPSQLIAPGFVDTVAGLVASHRLPAGSLVLEITESGIFADLDAARRTVTELRGLGVGVSLDDFGVGYSSLAQLNAMPLDSVKIDRSFLAGVDTDRRQATFLHAVLRLAEEIGLPVVAEGVERPAQLTLLRALGCRHAQGYLLGRPVDAAEIPALLGGIAVPA
ncbi:diguanylate cyclase (GGDEF) domain-containing protein [Klenkia soli]|uniref:Diguanylate cyclase (GGDEF) domain-containing protein n=1 Tax=Klenkia soli TaxID=1052260 RepID=A0A1H0P6P7_9ACTN|nr:bifunctional diguanylate cyclase/phosphodiesterase [Klenkia soli]SDP00365.1 diguanylate cyclase (GGDEF) domain-containing protein [Klenkia soli]